MIPISVAFIDILGLTYDGSTLEKVGLGGSESAIIYMAKELSLLGFDVTVFNHCKDSPRSSEGVYDGVNYLDLTRLDEPNSYKFDVVVASRSVVAVLPQKYWGAFGNQSQKFEQIKTNAKLKILWLHDTFCTGDQLIEELLLSGDIDQVFTLSDFHTSYFTTCDHGNRRNFEVLKNKVFMTRNGIKKHIKEVDISKKNPNLFIYNASATKGMLPLVNKIWPLVKQHIPAAELRIIGGFYRFHRDIGPNDQENTVNELSKREDLKSLNVRFTGVIPQPDIARHLAEAAFTIFPGAFPETFGISTLESLAYNTPVITTRFGALEETAIGKACYLIDYPVEPNSLFPNINSESQTQKFVQTVVRAHQDKYLNSQKMQYCNIIREVSDWSTVALQWKQHFFKMLGQYLPVDEYRAVNKINTRVHQIFQRRFSNQDEWGYIRTNPQRHISIVSTFFNCQDYIEQCIRSVASQDYDNYTHYLIDDCSTDTSCQIAKDTISSLPENIRSRFVLYSNRENFGAIYNQVTAIKSLCPEETIIMMLDGDDSLVNNNTILQHYNTIYSEGAEFTYGSMWSVADRIPLIAQPYPEEIKKNRDYRKHHFAWLMPYTHLRTFSKHLMNNIAEDVFKDENGNWFRAGGDTALFYNVIEQADPSKIRVVQDVVYNYNDTNPLNDYKINKEDQTKTANAVISRGAMKMQTQIKKKILIAIPTAKYIEVETFKSIYDLDIPENVETTFQYFFGYNIDQIRNLIANWAIHFDYLLSVDSDIVLPKDCLTKMLNHDKDIVSGVYIQRKLGEHTIEIYERTSGGVLNAPIERFQPPGLYEIAGCGFGCVLVKSEVIRKMKYPYFFYKSALKMEDTVSEDVYFCLKAEELGFKLFVDSSIICDHIGSTVYRVDPNHKG